MKQRQMNSTETKPFKRHFLLRLIPILLSVILCCTMISCGGIGQVRALDGEALKLDSFSDLEVTQITVKYGTLETDIALPPIIKAFVAVEPAAAQTSAQETEAEDETKAILELTEIEVPVTWICESYDSETAGTYLFLSELNEKYTFEGDMPQITVVVRPSDALTDATPIPTVGQPTDGDGTGEPTPTPCPSITPDGAATVSPEPTATLTLEAYQITAFVGEPIAIEVARGTAIEVIPLPASLTALNALGEQIEVPVVWVNRLQATDEYGCDPNDYVAGSFFGYGPWVFTATLDAAYAYAGEPVTASVRLPDCMTVDQICGYNPGDTIFHFVIFQGGSVKLPQEITASMADGGMKNVPVSWSGSYDEDQVGEYRLRMSFDSGYSGGGAEAKVSVIRDYAASEVEGE